MTTPEQLLGDYAAKQDELRAFLVLCDQQEAEIKANIPEELRLALTRVEVSRQHGRDGLLWEIENLATQLKGAVLEGGKTLKGKGYQAVYNPRRISWDDAALNGYAAVHEEILQFRIEGQPSVSIRKAK